MADKISEETMAKFLSNLVEKKINLDIQKPSKSQKEQRQKKKKITLKCIIVKIIKTKGLLF